MKDKKVIIEELNRIKNLMGYDRSRTLNENINESGYDTADGKIARWLLPSGDIITGDKIKGITPKGAFQLNAKNAENAVDVVSDVSMVSSLVGGGETAAAVGTGAAAGEAAAVGTGVAAGEAAAVGAGAAAAGGEAAAAATFLGLGPVGWAIIGVASIAALGVWAYTKDDKMGMVEKLFDICQSSSDKDKWKRYMSDTEVKKNSGILYHAMEGLGTDEEAVYGVFKSFKSPGDFCAVGEKYENTFGESLLEALDGDFDYGWEDIANPLVEMTKKYAQTESEEYCKDHVKECADNLKIYCDKNPEDPKCNVLKSEDLLVKAKKCGHKSVEDYKNSDWKCDPSSSGGGNDGTGKSEYVNCNGEYHKGCKGPRIVQLQRCLGVGVDGKFGEETETALEEKTNSKTFKDEDVKKICGNK